MQNDEYLKDLRKTRSKIYSKNGSLVASCSPFDSEQVIIVGIRPPITGILIAQIVPDPSFPLYGEQPFGVFFPPNETLKKSLISFEGIRKAFGLTIGQLFNKLSSKGS